MNDINLTVGHIARHTPHGAGAQGRDAAIVDIAQDLLLRHLHGLGVLEALAFKGGTALRKLYAGNAGRFSLDLDFSSAQIGADPDDALTNLISAVDGLKVGPFNTASSNAAASGHSPTTTASAATPEHCRANST